MSDAFCYPCSTLNFNLINTEYASSCPLEAVSYSDGQKDGFRWCWLQCTTKRQATGEAHCCWGYTTQEMAFTLRPSLVRAAARMHFGEITTHIIAGYNFPFQISTHAEKKRTFFPPCFFIAIKCYMLGILIFTLILTLYLANKMCY